MSERRDESVKKCEELIKRFLSSLFSGSMPYLVLGANSRTWIYTNAPYEDVLIDRRRSEYVFHKVQFKSDVFDSFLELLPLLNNIEAVININKFKSFFKFEKGSKLETKLSQIKIGTEFITVVKDEEEICLGRIIPTYVLNTYVGHSSLLQPDESAITINDLDLVDIGNKGISFVTVYTRPVHSLEPIEGQVNIPIKNGYNVISCKSYVKNIKSGYTLQLVTWMEKTVMKCIIKYTDCDIDVISSSPFISFFPCPVDIDKVILSDK